MKKGVLFILFALFTLTLSAVPAKRGGIDVSQPDGSTLTIMRFGDEFFNYTTTTDGYLVVQREGLYYYADLSSDGCFEATSQRVSNPNERSEAELQFLATRPTAEALPTLGVAAQRGVDTRSQRSVTRSKALSTTRAEGSVRGIVILVEFADQKFTYTNSDFHSMLNDENYSANGGTGSARDFFVDNSMGRFQPSFDVVGPYTLSEPMKYYGGNDSEGVDQRPRTMVAEACELADAAGLDFSQYDSDSNGFVDMVFVFYAGYNEAEGAHADTLWPHMWSLSKAENYDGKRVYVYACTSELRGSLNSPKRDVMAGIGTFTHEYGHTLGLVDSYDTTAEKGGESSGLNTFDIMSTGSYNNDGSTPPYYCAYQRYHLGWLEPQHITSVDNYELEGIGTNSAYIVETEVEDEYYLLEYRNSTERGMRKWDGYIGYNFDANRHFGDVNGLFITHIDRSANLVNGLSAAIRWQSNEPNAILAHECARVVYSDHSVVSVDMESANYPRQLQSMIFPGHTGNDTFTPTSSPAAKSWAGVDLPIKLSNIGTLDGKLRFTNGTPSGSDDEERDETIYGEGYPFIKVEVGEWSDIHNTLKLSLKNVAEYDNVVWSLDGEEISAAALHIVKRGGKYRITCRVTSGGNEIRLTKIVEL